MIYAPPRGKRGYSITLFVDSSDSWIIPWVEQIKNILSPFHEVNIRYKKTDLAKGDFNFLLGCTRILEKKYLDLSTHNIVIHESDLPKGKGWSPITWQILEGKNKIPVVLFEASENMDEGPIYVKDYIELRGNELLPEIKIKQGIKTIELILQFLNTWPDIVPFIQKKEFTYYNKRTEQDDMLDIHKSIADQFDHLRIVDNEKYPAWFKMRGKKYKILIFNF